LGSSVPEDGVVGVAVHLCDAGPGGSATFTHPVSQVPSRAGFGRGGEASRTRLTAAVGGNVVDWRGEAVLVAELVELLLPGAHLL
jgi:hypothetical protein